MGVAIPRGGALDAAPSDGGATAEEPVSVYGEHGDLCWGRQHASQRSSLVDRWYVGSEDHFSYGSKAYGWISCLDFSWFRCVFSYCFCWQTKSWNLPRAFEPEERKCRWSGVQPCRQRIDLERSEMAHGVVNECRIDLEKPEMEREFIDGDTCAGGDCFGDISESEDEGESTDVGIVGKDSISNDNDMIQNDMECEVGQTSNQNDDFVKGDSADETESEAEEEIILDAELNQEIYVDKDQEGKGKENWTAKLGLKF